MNPPKISAAILGLLLALPLSASPQFIPSSTKYKDSSLPIGRGQAGNASIEARALLGADGVTDVELTTGSFDGALQPTGTIEKVQIKTTDPASTTNENGLGTATHVARVDGLLRHEQIELHVNVKAGETTVVQAAETVKLRPSLLATDFAGPAFAIAGAPAIFSATVRETNGDLGARASCVLLANGQEVDRAQGIWVDAGDNVACRFAHTFAAPGAYDVRVRVTDSDPADYRGGDDESGASITVYPAGHAFDAWSWSVKDYVFRAHSIDESADFSGESTPSGWNQSSDFYAMIANRAIDLPNVRFSVSEETDGEPISAAEITQVDTSPICAYGFDSLGRMLSACNLADEGGTPFVTLSVNRSSGDVTYLSHGWRRQFNPATRQYDVYYFDTAYRNTWGVQKRLGNTVSLRVALADGTTAWEERPFLVLEPYALTNDQPRTCREIRGRGIHCTEQQYSEEGKQGLANYQ